MRLRSCLFAAFALAAWPAFAQYEAVLLHPDGFGGSFAMSVEGGLQFGTAYRNGPGDPIVRALIWSGSANSYVDLTPAGWETSVGRAMAGGSTWSTSLRLSTQSSVGNIGNPNGNFPHIPPGDFISVDSDPAGTIAAWCDSRNWPDADPNKRTQIFVRRILN